MDKDFFKKINWPYFIYAGVMIVLGILFIIFPDKAFSLVCYLLGVALLALGVWKMVEYFRTAVRVGNFALAVGVCLIAFGVYLMTTPGLLLNFFLQLLGIAIIVEGVVKLQYALDAARVGKKNFWLFLVFALLSIVFGILLLTKVFDATALVVFCGISLLVDGIGNLIVVLVMANNTTITPYKRK